MEYLKGKHLPQVYSIVLRRNADGRHATDMPGYFFMMKPANYLNQNHLLILFNMGKKKHLSTEEKEYIKVNMLIKSVGEMAQELGRNYYTIYRYIDRTYGVERSHSFTPQDDKIIIDLYKKNVRADDIAKLVGTDRCTIYNRARKLGIIKQVHVKRT